jgi:hypothetical protein
MAGRAALAARSRLQEKLSANRAKYAGLPPRPETRQVRRRRERKAVKAQIAAARKAELKARRNSKKAAH